MVRPITARQRWVSSASPRHWRGRVPSITSKPIPSRPWEFPFCPRCLLISSHVQIAASAMTATIMPPEMLQHFGVCGLRRLFTYGFLTIARSLNTLRLWLPLSLIQTGLMPAERCSSSEPVTSPRFDGSAAEAWYLRPITALPPRR